MNAHTVARHVFLLFHAFCASIVFAQPSVSISSPAANTQFTAPANVTITASASANNTFPYLQISNPGSGWRKLKLGYGDNIWYPNQNVSVGGNNTMEITLKTLNGTINWNNIQVRPQSNGSLALGTYINSAVNLPDGWKKVSIPMAQFGSSVNFTAVTYIEIPYSINTPAFTLAIREIKFTGGTTPFVWFGATHYNNAHDGATQDGSNLLTTLQQGSTGTVTLNRVDFFSAGTLLSQDFTAPYTHNWNNLPAGTYTITAALNYNNNVVVNSAPLSFTVLPPPTPSVALLSPANGTQFYQGTSVALSAVAGTPSPSYLQINNANWGWLKLKLGYSSQSLWYPANNVTSGANNTLEITLKDFNANADWSKLQIRPQGVSTNPVVLGNYIENASVLPDGWKKISIPLSAFPTDINFQSLTFIEIPYSVNAGPFHIGVSEIKFTGGTTPFLWFGTGKTDNYHDGATGWGGTLPTELVSGTLQSGSIDKVQFYANDVLLAEKTTAPFTANCSFAQAGNYALTSRACYNSTQWVNSAPANVTVLPIYATDTIQVQITFNTPPTVCNVQKAPLKYNKDFAFSLTLDDGLADAYSVAFPLFKGGTVAANGYNCPGLYYSDGCGNQLPFRGGLAINAVNDIGQDMHSGAFPDFITWTQLQDMYNHGWDVLNHSLSHRAGWTGSPLPNAVYTQQVIDNTNYVQTHTSGNIRMSQFVVPSGDSYYYPFAFNNGMKAVYNQFWMPDFQYGLQVDVPLQLNNFLLNRNCMDDNPATLINQINSVATQSLNGNRYWWNDFTHNISCSGNPIGGGLQFSTFRQYMEHIAGNYGANGLDNVWAASLQEVQEYLVVREGSVLNWQQNGNQLTATLYLTNVPDSLRHNALTLLIDADQTFSGVQIIQGDGVVYTYNGNVNETQLVNLEWGTYYSSNVQSNKTDKPDLASQANTTTAVSLYPNPTSANLAVSFTRPVSGNCQVKLLNQMGQTVFTNNTLLTDANTIPVSLATLPNGIYYLQCTVGGEVFETLKVVKSRF